MYKLEIIFTFLDRKPSADDTYVYEEKFHPETYLC